MLYSGMAKRNPGRAPSPPHHPPKVHEVVDPRWLLKAGAVALAVAFLCGYATLCWLFYQGQWQFALHPSRIVAKTPATLGLQFQPVRFAVDATGQPQLSGWFIPSDSPGAPTALMLHSGDGDISDALPTAQLLHTARLNVFLFDYRGFGASLGDHPTEALMQADAESALTYLTSTRGIAPTHIISFGQGVGASLATRLCAEHHDLAALILDSPTGDIEASVAHDARSKFIPTSLFLHEHFALTGPLSKLTTPKLLISHTGDITPVNVRTAADPKVTVELRTSDDVTYVQTLTRFLDLYAPPSIPTL
jgi:acetyl esterase/lipase